MRGHVFFLAEHAGSFRVKQIQKLTELCCWGEMLISHANKLLLNLTNLIKIVLINI